MALADSFRRDEKLGASLFQAALLLFTALLALLALLTLLDWLLRTDSFPARHVRFEGEFRHVSQRELERSIKEAVRGNFLMLNLDAVREQVETIPWVYQASVRRAWPRDIAVQFEEQRLAARWGERAFVNHVGQAVAVEGVEQAPTLVRLDGPEGTSAQVLARYQSLARALEPARLEIRKLVLTARRTWRVELDNGLTLVLDRSEPEQKLQRFARVYAQTLAPVAASVRLVDLRYANGFAVRWVNGEPPLRPARNERAPAAAVPERDTIHEG
jgi:cell division protein FtsQ